MEKAGRARVLIVDDDPALRKLLMRTFAAEYDINEAGYVQEALRVALERKPDIVVTDMSMPGETGEDLVRALRAQPDFDIVPIVVVTAETDPNVRVRLLQAGAQDYILKPFQADEVFARVKNLTAVKRARELLQAEVADQQKDLDALARDVIRRGRQVEKALKEMTLAHERAEEASAFKSTFLQLVSHELRTPVTVIQLGLQMLLRRPRPVAEQTMLERVMAATAQLGALVESVLQQTAMERDYVALDVVSFDVGALVQSVAQEYASAAAAKGIAVAVRVGELEPFASEPRSVRRVLRALLDNAVKFTTRGGVDVAVDGAPLRLRITVKDSGPGIDPSAQARVFEPFETLEAIQNKHAPGLGLGLAIARASVRLLGGEIELSSHPGEGCTFTVSLPDLGGAPTR